MIIVNMSTSASSCAPPASSAADLERLFQDACANASPSQQSLLQEVKTLGRYPNRYQHPANKAEAAENALAKKLAQHESELSPAALQYLEAMKTKTAENAAASTATECAAKAEDLMQRVRALGRLPACGNPRCARTEART